MRAPYSSCLATSILVLVCCNILSLSSSSSLAFVVPTTTSHPRSILERKYLGVTLFSSQDDIGDNISLSANKSSTITSSSSSSSSSRMLRIPIFPLRKSVRLPTDRLQLNLYEERYLAMSEYILLDDDQNRNTKSSNPPRPRRIFGAIYASDKPQLVRTRNATRGPVVPILSVGDIGSVFYVQESEEDMIPTADLSFSRRRIRLNAVGVGRFRIEKILHDGCGGGRGITQQEMSAEDNGDGGGPLPFILVEASWIRDKSSSVDDDDDASENKRLVLLALLVQEQQQMLEQRISQTSNRVLRYDESGSENEKANLQTNDDTLGTLGTPPPTTSTPLRQEDMVGLEAVVGLVQSLWLQTGLGSDFVLQEQDSKSEIFSFAAASALGAAQQRSAKEMADVLQMESTRERLETIVLWRKNGGVFWK